jgi:alpha-D-xyloside xylohydrolase
MRKITLLIATALLLASCKSNILETKNGFTAVVEKDSTKVSINAISPTIIKVAAAKNDSVLAVPSLVANEEIAEDINVKIKRQGKMVHFSTDSVSLQLDLTNGNIVFVDKEGNSLLKESGKTIQDQDYQIKQNFTWQEDEVLYGLGQHEIADINMRGKKIELIQENTKVSVPVILSTKGYGIFWDNYSRSIFNDSTESSHITSKVGDKIQYYFIKGNQFDNIISDLRKLTGEAPMVPKWVLGYVQSRNRYKTREELMTVVQKHRELNIPLDAIILDYMHWGDKGFGSMVFDSTDFPNPEVMIEKLHEEYNCKLIVSVWPTFTPGNKNWHRMNDKGYLLDDVVAWHLGQVFDAYDPEAGELYYNMIKNSYLDKGVDGIWFDATEPERLEKFELAKSKIGNVADYLNLYSYFDMKHYTENHSKNANNRTVILTRSAFLGQQKFGTIIWSGDIGTDFKALKEQIPTGLNFCMTGIPYWNTDIGGYTGGNPDDPAYREVFIRWFQYGAFTPFFRAHGRRYPYESRSGKNEMWSFGSENQKILTKYIELRYRLMPYIYTMAHKVSTENFTMMRALAFDFLHDEQVYEINDQFMFGESIMVCPVADSGAISRKVYLPKGTNWYNFWTGEKFKGGQTIEAAAPLDIIPLFIKSGTILPMGKIMQYSSENQNDTLELNIYGNENSSFTVYEDEGDNYNYLEGKYAEIPINYSAANSTLSIGSRKGSYKGMLEERIFRVILNKKEITDINYSGAETIINLK